MKVLHITRTLPKEMLGPMYLSRAVKDAGHEMRSICLPDPRWLAKIRDYKPDVVTWSLMTGNHRPIFDVNRFLKSKFDFFSLMGGPHVTFVPESAREKGVDALSIGEGEGAIVELLETLQRGGDWRQVQNLTWADEAGEFFGISAFWFRLGMVLAPVPGGVPGMLIYLLLWIMVPKE